MFTNRIFRSFTSMISAVLLFSFMSASFAGEPVQWQSLSKGIETSYQQRGSDRSIHLARIDLSAAGVSLEWQVQKAPSETTDAFVSISSNNLKVTAIGTARSSSTIVNPFPIFAMVNINDIQSGHVPQQTDLATILAPKNGYSLVAPHLIKQDWMDDSDRTGNYTAAGLSRDGKTLYIATVKHLPVITVSQTLTTLGAVEAMLLQSGDNTDMVMNNGATQQTSKTDEPSFYEYHAGGLDALLGTEPETTEAGASGTLVILSR